MYSDGTRLYINTVHPEFQAELIQQNEIVRSIKAHHPGQLKFYLQNTTEMEVAIGKGKVGPGAISSSPPLTFTATSVLDKVVKGVSIYGSFKSGYRFGESMNESIETGSPKPAVAQGIREIGGWAGAIAGAKLGGAAGTAAGVTSGPGVILTGLGGAILGGLGGYFGADWIADKIDEN